MNRRELALSLIGTDPTSWDRLAPLPPWPPWIGDALRWLVESMHLAATGDREGARALVGQHRAQDDALREWYVTAIWVGTARAKVLDRPAGREVTPKSARDRNPNAAQKRRVLERDGYRCCYCGGQVIPEEVMRAFSASIGDDVFQSRGNDSDRNGAAMVFRAVADHLQPLSLAGRTTDENLVTSCYPCNFSKFNFTIEQLGLDDPRDREPLRDAWCGLTELLPRLK